MLWCWDSLMLWCWDSMLWCWGSIMLWCWDSIMLWCWDRTCYDVGIACYGAGIASCFDAGIASCYDVGIACYDAGIAICYDPGIVSCYDVGVVLRKHLPGSSARPCSMLEKRPLGKQKAIVSSNRVWWQTTAGSTTGSNEVLISRYERHQQHWWPLMFQTIACWNTQKHASSDNRTILCYLSKLSFIIVSDGTPFNAHQPESWTPRSVLFAVELGTWESFCRKGGKDGTFTAKKLDYMEGKYCLQ